VRLGLLSVLGLLAFSAAEAGAAAPASLYNAPGQSHANVCAELSSGTAALRFPDGDPTGFELSDALSFTDGRCAAGEVRLDLHESIPSEQGTLAFHRGGNGYADGANVKYGSLRAADLAQELPAPVPSSGGRGAACTLAGGPAHRVEVESIPAAMHYKRPQDVPSGSNNGTSFEHYGDPAADQGDRTDIHYSYLLWSFVNVRGGGMVRALLAPGEPVRLCDADPVTMPAWDRAGNVNGEVTARYVRLMAGSCPLYGWMVWSHTYTVGGGGPVAHAVPTAGSPPAELPPGAGCPVAAPAEPPAVTTGDASADGTLAGTVDPNGVLTSWWFEYGSGPDYGSSTEPLSMSGADRVNPVSANVTGPAPGASLHYRLAAQSTHGTTYGEDRTLVAPGTPPSLSPPPRAEPTPADPASVGPAPPAATQLVLSRLRVSPGSFRRARRRSGAPARIRFALAGGPAMITLTFERRTARGRWARLRGSIVRRANGAKSVRFGGWLRGRRLARGRYRVRAAAGPGSSARRAGFTLR
jgi:hypothetical protein